MNNELADVLLNRRKDLKYSLRQVAYKTDLSATYISKLERGNGPRPNPDDLKKLAKVYNLDYKHLLIKAGYLDHNDLQESDTNIFMYANKEEFDALPKDTRNRIIATLSEQADFLINKYKKGDK
ncbi:transcriptional regulator [Staphylococcus hyicus]|uniref:helix-turn-helix domain-containing protein n=1 Tax=Staphylococcus hyicus TaxID=1284 RepID=UPI00211BEA7C|nr:helix-turn-helix domain-containing protein [Staphylococcus hyicus]MCQ9290654.1 transcriptional regulator [Staphylococcus hyicus]MCQ9305896.1 transcriptional regulator [Staphylococcus hyicus]MCQ9308308.1 transcriptional regulator [Staphylococcus hyicus]MCQ9310730.1 transcriptional regulator [Staphylococcus hyicus]